MYLKKALKIVLFFTIQCNYSYLFFFNGYNHNFSSYNRIFQNIIRPHVYSSNANYHIIRNEKEIICLEKAVNHQFHKMCHQFLVEYSVVCRKHRLQLQTLFLGCFQEPTSNLKMSMKNCRNNMSRA